MTERERLIELLDTNFGYVDEQQADKLVDYLIYKVAIVLPCKIGDRLFGIRRFHNVFKAQEGIVSEMYFTKDMKLQIVLKHVCRGAFGEKIFLSKEEAEKELEKLK